MDEVLIRAAAPGDAEVLSALALRSKAVWGYDEAFLAACRDELRVTGARIRAGGVQVAVRAGEVVGFVATSGIPPEGTLDLLIVEPEHLRRGLGRLLLGYAVDRARAAGHRALELDADPGAEPFYLAVGARRVGLVPSASIPGRMLPRLRLRLPC